MTTATVSVVRVYQDRGRGTGEYRVLVDRLWPRGMTKEAVDSDEWPKYVAPSSDLRHWYGHDPSRFDQFARRYRDELAEPTRAGAVARLREVMSRRRLVLLTATRDVEHSAAAVLRDLLQSRD